MDVVFIIYWPFARAELFLRLITTNFPISPYYGDWYVVMSRVVR